MARRSLASVRAREDVPDEPSVEVRDLDRQVIQLFALVEEAVAGATHAFLAGDREAARALVARDAELDELYRSLEARVTEQVIAGGVGRGRMQWLLALLSMLPELERSGDLAEHVAQRAARNLQLEVPARIRGLLEAMGELACRMWTMTADSYAEGTPADATADGAIDRLDDDMDDLHVQLIAEIADGALPTSIAIELALVGRFYERLGDHAVNISRRIPPRLRAETLG